MNIIEAVKLMKEQKYITHPKWKDAADDIPDFYLTCYPDLDEIHRVDHWMANDYSRLDEAIEIYALESDEILCDKWELFED